MADNASFTRGAVAHQYHPAPVRTLRTPGAVRISLRQANSNPWTPGIPQVWAVMRPSTAPDPNGAPFYLYGYPDYQLQRGSTPALKLPAQNKAMDPSNSKTWQRPYRFTT